MNNLKNFLRPLRKNDDIVNLAALYGKKWLIPPEERLNFVQVFANAAPTFSKRSHTAFVFRPLKDPDIKAQLFLDIDIKTLSFTSFDVQVYLELTKRIISEITGHEGPIEFYIVSKPEGYWKVLKRENIKVYCNGFHIYCPKVYTTVKENLALRARCKKHVQSILGHMDLYDIEDVIDVALCKRSNGLILIGDFKPHGVAGQYQIRSEGVYSQNTFNIVMYTTKMFWEKFKEKFELFYGELLSITRKPPLVLKKKQKQTRLNVTSLGAAVDNQAIIVPSTVSSDDEKIAESDMFSLQNFLECTKSHVPSNGEYVQFCMFFAKLNLTPAQINNFGALCNIAWNETENPNETARLIKKYKDKSTVNRASVERYLRKYTPDFGYDEEMKNKIFLKPEYELHNESEMFDDRERIWRVSELYEFFVSVYAFIWGNGEELYVYKERCTKTLGKTHFYQDNWVIVKEIPFSSLSTDKIIMVHPTVKELHKLVKGIALTKKYKFAQGGEELVKLVAQAKKVLKLYPITHEKAFEKYCEFLGDDVPEPREKKLGTYMVRCKQLGLLKKKYYRYDIVPYLNKDPTPDDCLNIFSGFSMKNFAIEHTFDEFKEMIFLRISLDYLG